MEYKVITFCVPLDTKETIRKLEREVNNYLKRGWKLQGGISNSNGIYSQAITLD